MRDKLNIDWRSVETVSFDFGGTLAYKVKGSAISQLRAVELIYSLLVKTLIFLKFPILMVLIEKIMELRDLKLGFKAYIDVEPVLKDLKSRSIKVIIISNIFSKEILSARLKMACLKEDFFSLLIASGSIGYEKPDDRIFNLAQKLSETSPEKIIHIGDSYKDDYLGAESTGIKAILIDRKGVYRNLDCRKISNLTQLLKTI